VRHWDTLALVRGESLVYWLKKLVFRSAWLDHRVKEGLLEVDWDDERQDFTFADTNGGRALLELLPTPSWHELQYRRRRFRAGTRLCCPRIWLGYSRSTRSLCSTASSRSECSP